MQRRSRASKPKTKTGCLTCKTRRKKCDEQKPECQNCIRLGLECREAPDIFRSVDLSRRKVAKHSYDACKDFEVCENFIPPDPTLTIHDASNVNNANSIISSVCSTPSVEMVWSLPVPPPTTLQTSSLEAHLLHHYAHRTSKVVINVDSPSNPLIRVLMPRAVTSTMLMNALYATTAFHVFTGNNDPEFRTASLRYYDKAASALQRQIADVESQTSGADLEVLLLTSIFLCKYEIISGARASNWRSHLKGVQDMLGVFQKSRFNMAQETVSYVQSFILYHSYIAGITRLERPSLAIASDQGQTRLAEIRAGQTDEIDPYMGTSSHYISLLHTATETVMLDCSVESCQSLMKESIAKIHDGITNDRQATRSLDFSNEHNAETVERLNRIANAYRNALIVYLHIIFDAVHNNDKTPESLNTECSSTRSLLKYTKDEAICACVHEMLQVPKDHSCVVGLVPLLFIVASETKNRVEFEFALERLTSIWKAASLGNIGTALELLQKIQHAQAKDWRQVLRGCNWDLIVT